MNAISKLSGGALLVALQQGVPIVERPFASIAREFGLTEADILDRIRAWFASGVARRFGAVFDSHRLGYASTLCAADIPAGELETAASRLTPHPGITHCYAREGRPNLWFTLTAPTEDLAAEVARTADAVAPYALLNLPAVRRFKIEAVFGATPGSVHHAGTDPGPQPSDDEDVTPLSEHERQVVRHLQGNLPLGPEPFGDAARTLGCDAADLLALLTRWRERGIIRRLGLVVRHQEMGFTANSMCVWNVAPAAVAAAGAVLARSPHVTHCYERHAAAEFPYNLYAMLHAGSRPEALARFEALAREAGLDGGRMLWSAREFKKTSPVFFAPRRALLFAAAGTSCPEARAVFDRIGRTAAARFPGVAIRWAFTSAGVRRKLARTDVPVASPEQALSALQADGIADVAVVSLHLSEGMEYRELDETVRTFRQAPGHARHVVLGRALFADEAAWRRVLETILNELRTERTADDAVVLVAHGSPDPHGAAGFAAAAAACRRVDSRLFLGMMLGSPSLADSLDECRRLAVRRAWLIPCLVAAGYTARNDIAGPAETSWKSRFEQAGIPTVTVVKGLGEYEDVVNVWMEQADRLLKSLEC